MDYVSRVLSLYKSMRHNLAKGVTDAIKETRKAPHVDQPRPKRTAVFVLLGRRKMPAGLQGNHGYNFKSQNP